VRKATMHYVLDAIEGLVLLALIISGFILWFALPEGSDPSRVFIFDRPTMVEVHRWLSVGLLVFFSTHIITHWTWIAYMTKSYFKRLFGKSET
jgi:hypothetical protein